MNMCIVCGKTIPETAIAFCRECANAQLERIMPGYGKNPEKYYATLDEMLRRVEKDLIAEKP